MEADAEGRGVYPALQHQNAAPIAIALTKLHINAADHLILVANNQPFAATSTDPPTHADPYATLRRW